MDFLQFLVLSAISHSPLKLFEVQSSKAYGKSVTYQKSVMSEELRVARGREKKMQHTVCVVNSQSKKVQKLRCCRFNTFQEVPSQY